MATWLRASLPSQALHPAAPPSRSALPAPRSNLPRIRAAIVGDLLLPRPTLLLANPHKAPRAVRPCSRLFTRGSSAITRGCVLSCLPRLPRTAGHALGCKQMSVRHAVLHGSTAPRGSGRLTVRSSTARCQVMGSYFPVTNPVLYVIFDSLTTVPPVGQGSHIPLGDLACF